jgi:methionyl-tRNA synthetase
VLAMLGSYFDGVVPEPAVEGAADDLPEVVARSLAAYDRQMDDVALSQALASVWEIVGRANGYLVEKEPWKVAKDEGRRDELAAVLYAATETLRILAVALRPVMPNASARLWGQLGIGSPIEEQRLPEAGAWGGLAPGTRTSKGEALFPRLDP